MKILKTPAAYCDVKGHNWPRCPLRPKAMQFCPFCCMLGHRYLRCPRRKELEHSGLLVKHCDFCDCKTHTVRRCKTMPEETVWCDRCLRLGHEGSECSHFPDSPPSAFDKEGKRLRGAEDDNSGVKLESLRDCLELLKARGGLRFSKLPGTDIYRVTLLNSGNNAVVKVNSKNALMKALAKC